MNRREFLQTGIGAGLLGSAVSCSESRMVRASQVGEGPATGYGCYSRWETPAILGSYSAADHRRRLENIAICERGIRKCMRRHAIASYLAGQCVYNLGEYPCRKIWDPDEWDEGELDRLRDHGIRLIHVHEEWNDALRLFGQTKHTPANPAGFRRFLDMVHARDMKLLVYFSSGFFDLRDPDFRPEWMADKPLVEIYWQYALCSPASTGWRAYLLPRLVRLLDEYPVDGIYNDLGYPMLSRPDRQATKDEVLAFTERPDHDGALEDLLGLMYAEVHRRGGVVKLHHSGMRRPMTDSKVYDYLWVGEGVTQNSTLRETTKNYPPYVSPCLDMSRAAMENEDELYLQAIPYMQFPVLQAGRPFTGERGMIPGIEYPDAEKCFWTRHCRAIWKYYQQHPEGPYTRGWWDSCPGRPEAGATHERWLKRYLPMVEEGTRAYLEIADSDLLAGPLPEGVVATAFANRELYLVAANYGNTQVEMVTRDAYVAVDRAGRTAATELESGATNTDDTLSEGAGDVKDWTGLTRRRLMQMSAAGLIGGCAGPQGGAKPGEGTSAAEGQHAQIGVKDQEDPNASFKRTTHPEAQWFPKARLGLFVHWGISSVHGGIDLSWGMMKDTPWDRDGLRITPNEYFALADPVQSGQIRPGQMAGGCEGVRVSLRGADNAASRRLRDVAKPIRGFQHADTYGRARSRATFCGSLPSGGVEGRAVFQSARLALRPQTHVVPLWAGRGADAGAGP